MSPLYAFVKEALLHHFQGLRLLEALSSSPCGFQCHLWELNVLSADRETAWRIMCGGFNGLGQELASTTAQIPLTVAL